ncbi:MAG TPA: potassium-transporting ATPase subunit KdpA [Terriglobales bacterium]|nr:potassium-transporting ATPase subunit KdpA [Terriglobales bacterium]
MTARGILQIAVYFVVLLALTKPVGLFLFRLFEGRRTILHPVLRPLERFAYRMTGVGEETEQTWMQYAGALLAFSIMGFLFAYLIQRLQGHLPFNPAGLGTPKAPAGATALTPDLAFNTAVSFVTNTNWQAYSGETTLSYFVQMAALTTQNVVSAAAGVAMSLALMRGFARQRSKTIGNFWVDLTRGTLYLFLPFSLAAALFLCAQGSIQNFHAPVQATTLEGARQTIPQGPVASQEAIKLAGTNGGGYFNANSAHPFENPTPLTNLVQMLLIFLVPAGLTYAFGMMVGDTRQGWALFGAMSLLFLLGTGVVYHAEQAGNPNFTRLGIAVQATDSQPGGNMEGKEVRFGIPASSLFAVITTDASCGAVDSAHDSLTPIGGLVALFNMQLGEVVFGGVGAGLKGILLFAILAVFIAGLMVGRTPEYLGKRIEQKEVKMAMLALIATAAGILIFTALSAALRFSPHGYWNPPGAAIHILANQGPHGFSELLYAYTSATANNGSAFAGLDANTPWFNLTTGLAMLIGRFLFLIPLLAVAGSLAAKTKIPTSSGTFPTHGPLFVGLLVGTTVLVGALTFFPALALGPIAEQYLMHSGRLFGMSLLW